MANIKPKESASPPENTDKNTRSMSRENFLEMYNRFQEDLFREYMTENELTVGIENALKQQRTDNSLFSFYTISTIRFREHKDIANALKLYYQAASRLSVPLIYILKKENGKVSVTFGCISATEKNEDKKRFEETAKILPTILPGFLPGVECSIKQQDDITSVVEQIKKDYKHRRVVFGVPGERSGQEQNAQQRSSENNRNMTQELGIERVLDSVNADFIIVGYSEPISNEALRENQAIFSAAHDLFHYMSKQTENLSHSVAIGDSEGGNSSISHTKNEEGISISKHYGDSVGRSLKKMWKRWWGSEGWFRGEGGETSRYDETKNKPGDSHTEQEGKNWSHSKTETDQSGITVERTNELARQTEVLLSRQMKRLEKGLASGMWRHTTQVASNQSIIAERVANILCGYWGGDEATIAQVRTVKIADKFMPKLPLFQFGMLPINCIENPLPELSGVSTLLTSDELAKVAALPLHEVPGVVVEKLTDYGRNFPELAEDNQVMVGKIIDHETPTELEIKIGFEQLKRHTFVTGATGAGKSTTMRQLLINLSKKNIPFLVIEPIKREYRELQEYIPDLQVITLGSEDCNVSLNPFAVEDKLGLIPHIDNLKAAFNATMGNYSSMPFILEDMIYRAYSECGWDLVSGKNLLIDKINATGFPAHTLPIMSDLLPLVESSIKGFFPNQSDYGNSLLGALRARISSMTRGAKGNVLNSTANTISMDKLLSKPCVIELWPFTDNEEKAFIMALLMIKLYEYRQSIDIASQDKKDRPLEHVLVIEEAHRLLAKPQAAGEHSSNGRQKAVEFFADILAEIRSYGQGIVVVDQIPSKLIPDVLKNTDVKIAHRLADKEDREVLGGTMNLTQEQIVDVAKLRPGEGLIYFGGLKQAMKIKVPLTNIIEKEEVAKNEHRFLD